jgi:iron complex outermembrane receptor protein
MSRISGCLRSCSTSFLFLVAFCCAAAHAQIIIHFDLPAQPLARSLTAIGTATDTNVGFSASQVAGLLAPSLKANLTMDGALERVLAGTGLRPQHLDDHTIVIASTVASTSVSVETPLLVVKESASAVDVQTTPSQAQVVGDPTEKSPQPIVAKDDLEEIIVTGTHLRGVTDTGSSLQLITADDIQRAGITTVADIVQLIPQAFGGLVTDNTFGSINGGSGNNLTAGTGIDLRGLGPTSTLVLVNGRRLAPSNAQFEGYTDISAIPLAAVDRVEIVADGASAIYGSDAVGGVVNFILKRNFEGAETTVKYGAVTQGSLRDIGVSQIFGHAWDTGSGLLSYEYDDRTPLSAADRSYSDTAQLPYPLLPEKRRNSFFATVTERVQPALELFADGAYSQQSNYQVITSPFFSLALPSYNYSYSATLGGRIDLSDGYQLSVSSSYASSGLRDKVIFDAVDVPFTKAHTSVWSNDAILNGPLWSLPAGPILMAVGGQYRRESLNDEDPFSDLSFLNDRKVIAGFVEFSVPIVGPGAAQSAPNRLVLSLADRYEHYSDFGSTNNPKVGFIWWPERFVKVRGSYGKSFRAPTLIDLNPVPSASGAVLDFDPTTGTNRPVVSIFGGNPSLEPETARTWSLGMDLSPNALSGLRASASYYNIHYTNRISSAGDAGYSPYNGLLDETVLGPEIVQRNPPPSVVSQIIAEPNFTNQTGSPLNPSAVAAALFYNQRNLSKLNTSGVDFNFSFTTNSRLATFESGLDATYVLNFDTQFTSTTPVVSILNTPYNPINLKLRAREVISHGNVTFGLFVNYVNSYKNNHGATTVPVASWTTADANINYEFPVERGALHGTSLTLSVRNLTNRDPPFVLSTDPVDAPINFDGANANPLGRFISVQLRKKW